MAAAIVRKIDQLGRIVLPIELRNSLNISANDQLEFLVDGDRITMKKRKSACEFCDSTKDVINFSGRSVCRKCINKMNTML